MSIEKSIVCFGEVLWDIFSTERVVGGAPVNVAFHVNNFKMNAYVVSAVGKDTLGSELRLFCKEHKITDEFIYTNPSCPTGTVQVELDHEGVACYRITENVAWDFLSDHVEVDQAIFDTDVLIFGSLACRNKCNYLTLKELIRKAKAVVFDVNLRPPFYDEEIIRSLLVAANIVKMNVEEINEITGWYDEIDVLEAKMRFVKERFDIEVLIVTCGKYGARCLHDDVIFSQDSFHVELMDTVGSGDSFLAAFLFKMLSREPWQECLRFGCAMGALVASRKGATPQISELMVDEFIQKSSVR